MLLCFISINEIHYKTEYYSYYDMRYVVRYRNLNDTISKIEFAYNNRIEYYKGDTIIHISDFNYLLDTLIELKFGIVK